MDEYVYSRHCLISVKERQGDATANSMVSVLTNTLDPYNRVIAQTDAAGFSHLASRAVASCLAERPAGFANTAFAVCSGGPVKASCSVAACPLDGKRPVAVDHLVVGGEGLPLWACMVTSACRRGYPGRTSLPTPPHISINSQTPMQAVLPRWRAILRRFRRHLAVAEFDRSICVPVATGAAYETVIGLEVHAQVLTKSKMYCGCSADYANADPNTFVCPVCLGLPGALPVMNRAAIEAVIRTGLALNCEIPAACKLDRKNYVYPDLPKGYQISQYDLPLCVNGTLDFTSGALSVRAGITRVHIEEDTGRLVHEMASDGSDASLVDLNRSGVPLMEIVGEPDLRSPAQARDYLIALRQILRYIGASSGNMEDGAFRCDANVSLRPIGSLELGAKVEIKNMNSFRSVERALRFEVERQAAMLEAGERIGQETRGWVEARGVTVPQRTKEQAHDYRYFPEPDLPPLTITASETERLRATLPELPVARRQRFEQTFELSAADAAQLTSERAIADYFESALGAAPTPERAKSTANWILNDLLSLQRERALSADTLPVTAGQLSALISMVRDGDLSQRAAKELLPGMTIDESARQAAERLNLLTLSDDSELRAAVAETLSAFPEAVADYRRGKTAAMGRLIGETIKRTGGRAKPETVRGLLVEALTAE